MAESSNRRFGSDTRKGSRRFKKSAGAVAAGFAIAGTVLADPAAAAATGASGSKKSL